MQFASGSCTLSPLVLAFFLLFAPEAARCQSAAAPGVYDQIERQALTMFQQGNAADATSLLENTLAEVEHGNDPQWEADILAVLGFIYEKTGQYTQAEDALNRSVNEWTRLRGPDTPTLAGPLGNLGELYFKAGQYSRAEKLLLHALSINRTYGSPSENHTRLLINLGNVYFEEHKTAEAEQAAREALTHFMSMKEPPPDTSAVFSLLGSICYRAGRPEEAEYWLQRELSFRVSTLAADDPLVAASAANLAVFYAHSDQPEKARPLFQRAAAIFGVNGAADNFILNFYRHYAEFERKSGHGKEAKQITKSVDKLWARSAENTLSSQIVDISALRYAK